MERRKLAEETGKTVQQIIAEETTDRVSEILTKK
jgi:hypothetical protein